MYLAAAKESMVQINKWLAGPAAILLGCLYGVVVHPLPESTAPPRVQAATGAAACFGLLFVCMINFIHKTPKASGFLAVALIGVLSVSIYRLIHHVKQATCPTDNNFDYIMAGGGQYVDFVLLSGISLFILFLLLVLRIIGVDFNPLVGFLLWVGAVGIGLACAAGGRYRCSKAARKHPRPIMLTQTDG